MNNKVGIATEYYGSSNCGGLLQSFALQKKIEDLGYECEQICFSPEQKGYPLSWRIEHAFSLNPGEFVSRLFSKIGYSLSSERKRQKAIEAVVINNRNVVATAFAENIPHSMNVYSESNIYSLNDYYDVFVCGSDQIWTPYWLGLPNWDFYFLTFAKEEKKKIAYAASTGVSTATDKYLKKAGALINRMDFVSVRELTAKRLLQKYTVKDIRVMLDPTLLITGDEWANFFTSAEDDGKEYIFCYLLGNEQTERQIAKEISNHTKKELRALPYAAGKYCKWDEGFADVNYDSLSPDYFVNQIRYSRYVVTDSFHATVFSILFHKQFVVIPRDNDKSKRSTNSRLYSLLEMLGIEDRVAVDAKQALAKLNQMIDYPSVENKLNSMRQQSIEWLKVALEEEKE